MKEIVYNECFACGQNNPIGLKLQFEYEDNHAIANWECPQQYAGYPGLIHGGIVSTLLDEAMAKIVIKNVGEAVTGKMSVTFRNPLYIGEKVTLIGEISEVKGKIIKTKAKIMSKDMIIAEATAIYIKTRTL